MTPAGAAVLPDAGLATQLDEGLRALGLDLPAPARERLQGYVALLARWNAVYNLTAIREPARMVSHHLLDSLAALPVLDAIAAGRDRVRVLDVGSGAGLPGLPLAIARPAWQVTLREPVQKKVAFMTQAAAELGVPNAVPSLGRVEDLRDEARFAIVVSRAFADLASFVASSLAHAAPDGRLVALKGLHPDEELRELPASVVVEREVALDVPGVGAARRAIVLRRSAR
ncbi:MAG: ribosomal RNA small subunit methyltransferase G [Betaproteobacteria bacterium]|nr:MAG: ribosomal RNA small subunit methyltransferase G [Betaproteobacteria bacterium]